jgi:HK97 family phage prohead protease
METKKFTTRVDLKSGSEEGKIEAVISTFDIVDRDGEIVSRSAFKDGQPLPMVWAHDWAKPIGKGVIKVEPTRAVFKGQLFLDTTLGLDAYRTMKAMGDLQEFSWGFLTKKADFVEIDGEEHRRILETEAFEASAVLVGSNPETGLLAIKDAGRKYMGCDGAPDGSYEALSEELETAFRAQRGSGRAEYVGVIATFGDHFIGYVMPSGDGEMTYWSVTYGRSPDGNIVLGTPAQVEAHTSYAALKAFTAKRRRLSHHQLEAVIATLQALMGDDEDEEDPPVAAAAEAGKAAEPLTLNLAGAKLLSDLDAYLTRLTSMPIEDVLAVKDDGNALLRRLGTARSALDGLLKRADVAADSNPRELRRQFDHAIALIGPIHSGRRAG